MNKYHARATYIDNIRFASKKEAARYWNLKCMLRAGEITDLVLQPKFILQDGFVKDGVQYRPIIYKADFQYKRRGETVIEDTKGCRTKIYMMKRKMFEAKYPHLSIVEI